MSGSSYPSYFAEREDIEAATLTPGLEVRLEPTLEPLFLSSAGSLLIYHMVLPAGWQSRPRHLLAAASLEADADQARIGEENDLSLPSRVEPL